MNPEYALNQSLPYLTGKLEEAGIAVQVGINQTRGTMFLLLNGSVKCSIHELISALIAAEPNAHHTIMEPWIPYLIERTRIGETVLNNPEELRRRVHTEFVIADLATNPRYSYCRQYPGELKLILSIADGNTRFQLSDEQLDQCPLSVDELFYFGQMNTDDVAVDRVEQVGPLTSLTTRSVYISAKAANVPALMSRFQVHAPHGLFLMAPMCHLLCYSPVDPAHILQQLMAVIHAIRYLMAAASRTPGMLLSRDIIYYSPEGTYETITQPDNPEIHELLTNVDIDDKTFRAWSYHYLDQSSAFARRFLSR